VDGKVSCGFHVYIGVERRVVNGDRKGATRWRACLRKDGVRCGSETFSIVVKAAVPEGVVTMDGVPGLQARGPIGQY
jgi:hypothetical protein